MRYKLVIFDLDGTLMDTSAGILMSVKDTIKEYNMPELDEEQIKSFIGPPIQWSFEAQYMISSTEAQRMADTFRELYSTKHLFSALPYPGIYELLKTLRDNGVRLAVATYKREDYAIRLLKHFHFDEFINIMYGGDNEGNLKKRDIIKKCIDAAGINKMNQIVMVGDTIHDANGADALGMSFIGVSYGFGFNDEDAKKMSAICTTAEDILKYIK